MVIEIRRGVDFRVEEIEKEQNKTFWGDEIACFYSGLNGHMHYLNYTSFFIKTSVLQKFSNRWKNMGSNISSKINLSNV